ncbi:MAG: glucose-6-phosphate dehydrogenase assembly protein OpcA, partial [Chloroflexota bacterium]
ELGKLRYMVAGGGSTGDGFALRTSLLNMVVYAEREEEMDFAGRVIEDLASHHPSRALIVLARPSDGESHIEAQLAAHSHISRSLEQSVCCEEITLRVTGPAALHLHSVIVPLLVTDLPVYVWWTAALPADSRLFLQLMEAADRVIVDSALFEDQPGDLLRLAELAEQPRTTVGDLNWRRLEPWRDFFDRQQNIAEMRHHLSTVKSVEIRYADGHGAHKPAQAFLLLTWLARELGWDTQTLSTHGGQRLTFGADEGRLISAYLHAVKYPAVESGSLVSVKIACQSETASALLSISRTGDPYHLTVRTEHRGGAIEEHVRFEPAQASALLVLDLDAPPHDPEYSSILRTAVPLIMATRA